MADYDVVVVGSGFGGSVAALRLAEKGYRVAVLEAGRRFADDEFPETSWDVRNFLWAPALGCYGIQRISLLRNVLVLSGAGVGGGSLVYANTLYRPPDPFYRDPQWTDITDWKDELARRYGQAERMLGVTTYGRTTRADEAMKRVAERMGVAETFHPTPVGVYFGQSGVDPFFGGAGPNREACRHCGACMTGCRFNAKNTLAARLDGAHQAAHLHRGPGRTRGRCARYPAAAARDEGARRAPAPVGPAGRADPDELGVDPRRPVDAA